MQRPTGRFQRCNKDSEIEADETNWFGELPFFAGAKASGKQSEMRMQDNTVWEQNDKFIGDTWKRYEEYWVIKNDTRRYQIKRGWWNAGPEALVNRMVCEYTTGAYANIMGIDLKST